MPFLTIIPFGIGVTSKTATPKFIRFLIGLSQSFPVLSERKIDSQPCSALHPKFKLGHCPFRALIAAGAYLMISLHGILVAAVTTAITSFSEATRYTVCAVQSQQINSAAIAHQTPRFVGDQMNLCIWSWKRTSSFSASIHSTIWRGSIRPKMGEKRTAGQRLVRSKCQPFSTDQS